MVYMTRNDFNQIFDSFSVYLRPLEEDDWKYSVKWRQDELIWSMVIGQRYYVSELYERMWVKDHIENQQKNKVFVLCEKGDTKALGYVYLNNIDMKNRSCFFAKLLGDHEAWGKGYGTQMAMLALHYAFYELGLERVEARQLLTNRASIRVNEKCGFKTEGCARHAAFKDGQFVDLNLMSCLRSDYDAVVDNKIKELRINYKTGGVNL